MPIDYSKWDSLDCSDSESEYSCSPRVIRLDENHRVQLSEGGYQIKSVNEVDQPPPNLNSDSLRLAKDWSKRLSGGLVCPKSHLFSQDKYSVTCLVALGKRPRGVLHVDVGEESLRILHEKKELLSRTWYGKVKADEDLYNWQLLTLHVDWQALSNFATSMHAGRDCKGTRLEFKNVEECCFVEIEVQKLNDIPDTFYWWPKLFQTDDREIKRSGDLKFRDVWDKAHEEFRERVKNQKPMQL